MKILFAFTGGTIGSTLSGETISTDSSKPYKIIDAYREAFGIDFEYDTVEPYNELSENSTGDHLRALCDCVCEKINIGYDGIIVTHGTDTLQYSASAIAYSIGLSDTPVCVVSSNFPIEDPRSNALANLRGAVALIKNARGLGARGAFVSYRNPDNTTKIYRATHLLESKPFTDEVCTAYDAYFALVDGDKIIKNPALCEIEDEIEPIKPSGLTRDCGGILVLAPYVGMTYPPCLDGITHIILNSYHSGTINTKSPEAVSFFAHAREKGVKVYLTGAMAGPEYESATLFEKLGIIPIRNISPISAYIKLWMLLCAGRGEGEMMRSLSCDIAR